MKNYKGFEKKPYCNAHCPQAKATTVADTPEIRRLAENTRIQSQAKYHEDFEKAKGKGFTAIADDPETLRIKNTSKIISNVAYHGELERKKHMEEKRSLSGQEDGQGNNNNNTKHLNRMRSNNSVQNHEAEEYPSYQVNNYSIQSQQMKQQLILQQQMQQKQQQQQLQLQKQQQQMHYIQEHNGQPVINRHSQHLDGPLQQPSNIKLVNMPQQYPVGHPHQQQIIMRQQQQMMMQQQQQQRQSLDPNVALTRQPPKHLSNNNHPQQQMNKHQVIPNQQQHQIKYMTDPAGHQPSPTHLIGAPQLINSAQVGANQPGQRVVSNPGYINSVQQQPPHLIHGYNPQVGPTTGAMPKQAQQHYICSQPRHILHTSQMQPMNRLQIRPQPQQLQQQVPRRVFRAMYDYVANDVDEVSFFENDILIDCVNVDGNWLIGKVARSGQTGMLPANYVTEFSGH